MVLVMVVLVLISLSIMLSMLLSIAGDGVCCGAAQNMNTTRRLLGERQTQPGDWK
jgi:hypothetical protein